MSEIFRHPLSEDGKDPKNVRGDKITTDRYYSREYMASEWDHLWTKVWHIAGRENQFEEPGDYIMRNLLHESVMIVKQTDGSLKGFYNACAHRGQRLVWEDGSRDAFHCPYHGWKWRLDGVLEDVTDPDDFPQGNPCGKLTLKPVKVGIWGGIVWYTLEENGPSLLEFLEPIPDIFKNFPVETTVRVRWMTIDMPCNWKMFSDNFNESYHTRTAHPHIVTRIDQDHWNSRYEMYPNGHASIVHPGRPSLRDRPKEGEACLFDDVLLEWGLDPNAYPDYETKVAQGWLDLKEVRREKWKDYGFPHIEKLNDEELTDNRFLFLFPNKILSISADGCRIFIWEPHRDDPEQCSFEVWELPWPNAADAKGYKAKYTDFVLELKETETLEHYTFDEAKEVDTIKGQVIYQDMELASGQREGWRSRGCPEQPYFAAQETRVQRFHEVLNDYMAGSPRGR